MELNQPGIAVYQNGIADAGGWRRLLGGICDIKAGENGAGSTICLAGRLHALIRQTNLPRRRTANLRAALASGIDCIGLTLVESGVLEVSGPRGTARHAAGSCRFVDMSMPRDWLAVEGSPLDEVTLFVPRQRLASLIAAHEIDDWSAPAGSAAGAVIGTTLARLADHMAGLTEAEFDAFASAIIDMAAATVQASGGPSSQRGNLDSVAFGNIRRFIDKHIRSSALTPDLIGGTFGMSRAVLYRLFEPVGGVATYIRRQRMSLALQDLSRPGTANERIATIAHRLGYENASAFTRAFRETYGVAPARLPFGMVARSGRGDRLIDWLAPLCGARPPAA